MSTVLSSAALSAATDSPGLRASSRAAAPATWGVAIEVPSSDWYEPPLAARQRMLTLSR